jgi:TolB protein
MLVAVNHSRRRLVALAAALLLTAFVVGPATRAAGAPAAVPQGTIVFASARSGNFEIYSVRADGSHLGQLTRNGASDTDPIFSPDGRRILFSRAKSQLWLMNADGSGQGRLASPGYHAAWSPDSRRIAYQSDSYAGPLAVVGADGGGRVVVPGMNSRPSWSPDGRLIAFLRGARARLDLMVVGRDGRGLRRIRRNITFAFGWSPRGEITFVGGSGLDVVGPDGRGARRLMRGVVTELAWSPDGRRLAFIDRAGRLRVASAAGRGARDITPKGARWLNSPAWSPDGRWLALRSQPSGAIYDDLLVVAGDGSSSRPLTTRIPYPWGSTNGPPSWRPHGVTPARLGVAPVAPLPSETVSASRFQAAGPGTIEELAADGGRAAVIVEFGGGGASVEVWEPERARVVRLKRPCGEFCDVIGGLNGVAVAGTRVAWLSTYEGNYDYTDVSTATLDRPTPVLLVDEAALGGLGPEASAPVGHGGLLTFTVSYQCDADCPPGRTTGDVVGATIWRFGGATRCGSRPGEPGDGPRVCTAVAHADGELRVLAVDAERIAARTDDGVKLLTAAGKVLRDFPVEATAAALSGKRIALRTPDTIEVYDTGSGQLTNRFPVPKAVRLADLEGDLLGTASGKTVTLQRLSDGRTTTIRTGGTARAQLEPPGLFVAGGRSVTFTRMRDVLRLIGG